MSYPFSAAAAAAVPPSSTVYVGETLAEDPEEARLQKKAFEAAQELYAYRQKSKRRAIGHPLAAGASTLQGKTVGNVTIYRDTGAGPAQPPPLTLVYRPGTVGPARFVDIAAGTPLDTHLADASATATKLQVYNDRGIAASPTFILYLFGQNMNPGQVRLERLTSLDGNIVYYALKSEHITCHFVFRVLDPLAGKQHQMMVFAGIDCNAGQLDALSHRTGFVPPGNDDDYPFQGQPISAVRLAEYKQRLEDKRVEAEADELFHRSASAAAAAAHPTMQPVGRSSYPPRRQLDEAPGSAAAAAVHVPRKKWTAAETQKLIEWQAMGVSNRDVAERLMEDLGIDVSITQVRTRYETLAKAKDLGIYRSEAAAAAAAPPMLVRTAAAAAAAASPMLVRTAYETIKRINSQISIDCMVTVMTPNDGMQSVPIHNGGESVVGSIVANAVRNSTINMSLIPIVGGGIAPFKPLRMADVLALAGYDLCCIVFGVPLTCKPHPRRHLNLVVFELDPAAGDGQMHGYIVFHAIGGGFMVFARVVCNAAEFKAAAMFSCDTRGVDIDFDAVLGPSRAVADVPYREALPAASDEDDDE
jgi:hypothetical protein